MFESRMPDSAGGAMPGHGAGPVRRPTTPESVTTDARDILLTQRRAGNAVTVSLIHARSGLRPALGVLQRVMASVVMRRGDRGERRVGQVLIERGSGTAGGAHATAYAVFTRMVVNATEKKTFEAAMAGLGALLDTFRSLPGYRSATEKERHSIETMTGVVRNSISRATTGEGIDDLECTQTLQQAIEQTLRIRNAIPGTLIRDRHGKPVSGKKGAGEDSERVGVRKLGDAQQVLGREGEVKDPGGGHGKTMAAGMLMTFDRKALTVDVEDRSARYGAALAQHTMTVFAAFPGLSREKQGVVQWRFVDDALTEVDLDDELDAQVRAEVARLTGLPEPSRKRGLEADVAVDDLDDRDQDEEELSDLEDEQSRVKRSRTGNDD
ncbi:hypothetical protein [Pseudactinotalea sp. HY160]|uniref:hypothetical protein n=1 Tax=Pseudactinotalea sp. HY160 TaxID=2654490 RepID=UPI0018836F84|nr:hypothetical protein [Pseudactinotalea sp. HY160]